MWPRCLAAAFLAPCLGLVLAAETASGGTAPGPQDQIRQSTDQILAILKDPAFKAPDKKAERRKKIEGVVDERFNWPDMAQRSLGIHWRKRTDQEKKDFVPLYTELVRDTYMTKIEGYSGEQVHYGGEQVDGDYARVSVRIVTAKNTEIPVIYSLKKSGDQWLVYDVAVEGVRLVNNYRTQFNSMLTSMSWPEFLQKLKTKVEELRKG